MKKGEVYSPVPYPTDKHGLPIHPYELAFTPDWESQEKTNNHHHAFFARAFGRTAIGLAFRNLESNQSQLIIPEHVLLHYRYSGIKVPAHAIMLDRIWEDYETAGNFKVWDNGLRQYETNPISEDEIEHLERTYRGRE